MRKELEDRLVEFSALIHKLNESIEKDSYGDYITGQLMRSSTSAALNYGEAQGAESKRDFIHKISIVLKELRESNVNLRILEKINKLDDIAILDQALDESNQLVSIFYRTVQTARKNNSS